MEKYIDVKSLMLLKEIAKANCLGLFIGINKDMKSEAEYPQYRFANKPDISAVVDNFIKEHGIDDRSLDGDIWNDFDREKFWDCDKNKTIFTRNYSIVSKIIEAGYGANLVSVERDFSNRKKLFIFIKNDEILKIKIEQDKISRDNWLAKQT